MTLLLLLLLLRFLARQGLVGQRLLARLPWATVLLAVPAVLVFLRPETVATLEYQRGAVGVEPWRLLTGHWTHWSGEHLFWDLSAFLALGAIAELLDRKRLLLCLLLAGPLIALGLWCLLPEIESYRGLSGLDSALFALVAMSLLRRAWQHGDRNVVLASALALGVLLSKVIFEVVSGGGIFVQSAALAVSAQEVFAQEVFAQDVFAQDVVILPQAHLLGAAVGAAVAAFGSWREPTARDPVRRGRGRRRCYIAGHVEATGAHQAHPPGRPLAQA